MTITYIIGNSLYVNVTNRCTNACCFCIRANGESVAGSGSLWFEGDEPSKEDILRDIFKHDLNRFDELVFCGYGEPLVRFYDVVWICRRVKEVFQIPVRINTNGHSDLIAGKKTAKELAGIVDEISISLNAKNARQYDELCRCDYGEKGYNAMLSFAKDCLEYIPTVVLSVVDVLSVEDIEECRRIAESIGAKFRVRSKE